MLHAHPAVDSVLEQLRSPAKFDAIHVLPRVNERANTVHVKAGSSIYAQGDTCRNVYFLIDGWAFRDQYLEDGRHQILDFGLPGAMFGFSPCDIAPHGVQALVDCTLRTFPRGRLEELMHCDPLLAAHVANAMAEQQTLLDEHLTSAGKRSAHERVAYLLCELFVRARRTSATRDKTAIGFPLTQTHIGDALGLSSIHVNRMLSALRRDGIVLIRDRVMKVIDPIRLFQAAGLDPDDPPPWH